MNVLVHSMKGRVCTECKYKQSLIAYLAVKLIKMEDMFCFDLVEKD